MVLLKRRRQKTIVCATAETGLSRKRTRSRVLNCYFLWHIKQLAMERELLVDM